MCRLRLPRRAPRNVAHESTVTRPQSAPSANAISNFPEADFVVPIDHSTSGSAIMRQLTSRSAGALRSVYEHKASEKSASIVLIWGARKAAWSIFP